MSTNESVTIKVPRVPDYIRKEKKEVKLHIEEAKKLVATTFKKPRHENIVKYFNVAYDDFRKEIWVVSDNETLTVNIISTLSDNSFTQFLDQRVY